MNQEIIPAYSAYQKVIDLTLYHAFAELIVQMAQDDEVRILYRQQEVRQIWQRDQNVSGYFETYSLRYPGEVLERFEESWARICAFSALLHWPWATPASVRLTQCCRQSAK